MATGEVKFPISNAVRNLTVHVCVSGVKTARVRMWLGAKIIHFATWVIGCQSEIEVRK